MVVVLLVVMFLMMTASKLSNPSWVGLLLVGLLSGPSFYISARHYSYCSSSSCRSRCSCQRPRRLGALYRPRPTTGGGVLLRRGGLSLWRLQQQQQQHQPQRWSNLFQSKWTRALTHLCFLVLKLQNYVLTLRKYQVFDLANTVLYVSKSKLEINLQTHTTVYLRTYIHQYVCSREVLHVYVALHRRRTRHLPVAYMLLL